MRVRHGVGKRNSPTVRLPVSRCLTLDAPEQSKDERIAVASRGIIGQIMDRLPITVLWALIAQGLLSVTRLLTSMTVGGRFGSGSEEQLGYYSNAFSVLMILIAIFEAMITTPLTVFHQKQSVEQRPRFGGHMLMSAFLLLGLMSSLALAWFMLEYQFGWLENPNLTAVLIAVTAVAPLQLLREFARRWLLANLEARPAAIIEFMFAGLFAASILWLIFTDQVTGVSVFVALGVVNLVGLAVWWMVYRSRFEFARQSFGSQLNENIRYGRWVAGENVCSALTMYFCNWYLMFKIDEAAAGVFFACFTVVLLANPFLLGICSILAPRAAAAYNENGYDGLWRVLLKFGVVLLSVLSLFSAVLWFAGDPITSMFFGPKYSGYFLDNFGGQNQVTGMLAIAMPLMALSYLAAFGLLAINRPFDNFYSALAALVVLIGMTMLFENPSLMTAAICFVTSFAVAAVCRSMFLLLAFARNRRLVGTQ